MYKEEEYFTYTAKQKLKAKQLDMKLDTSEVVYGQKSMEELYNEKIKTMNTFTPVTPEPQIDKNAVYLVDFSKMTSLEDLITVLASIGFSFSPMHPQFDNIKHLLALDKPIKIGNTQSIQEAQAKEIQLPKLKTLK